MDLPYVVHLNDSSRRNPRFQGYLWQAEKELLAMQSTRNISFDSACLRDARRNDVYGFRRTLYETLPGLDYDAVRDAPIAHYTPLGMQHNRVTPLPVGRCWAHPRCAVYAVRIVLHMGGKMFFLAQVPISCKSNSDFLDLLVPIMERSMLPASSGDVVTRFEMYQVDAQDECRHAKEPSIVLPLLVTAVALLPWLFLRCRSIAMGTSTCAAPGASGGVAANRERILAAASPSQSDASAEKSASVCSPSASEQEKPHHDVAASASPAGSGDLTEGPVLAPRKAHGRAIAAGAAEAVSEAVEGALEKNSQAASSRRGRGTSSRTGSPEAHFTLDLLSVLALVGTLNQHLTLGLVPKWVEPVFSGRMQDVYFLLCVRLLMLRSLDFTTFCQKLLRKAVVQFVPHLVFLVWVARAVYAASPVNCMVYGGSAPEDRRLLPPDYLPAAGQWRWFVSIFTMTYLSEVVPTATEWPGVGWMLQREMQAFLLMGILAIMRTRYPRSTIAAIIPVLAHVIYLGCEPERQPRCRSAWFIYKTFLHNRLPLSLAFFVGAHLLQGLPALCASTSKWLALVLYICCLLAMAFLVVWEAAAESLGSLVEGLPCRCLHDYWRGLPFQFVVLVFSHLEVDVGRGMRRWVREIKKLSLAIVIVHQQVWTCLGIHVPHWAALHPMEKGGLLEHWALGSLPLLLIVVSVSYALRELIIEPWTLIAHSLSRAPLQFVQLFSLVYVAACMYSWVSVSAMGFW
eukprot:TRINITY_DN32514_c0_g1_i2.p1 TRINITY_DN32514_c0_g1~~TRINITY_DN32514_c0_g1_i2.p1  ORF type:complete len:740 (-),score=106.57 TRINITY_DN32514_c0_g1_i2:61-2280(-)